jgi:hypothetical protein
MKSMPAQTLDANDPRIGNRPTFVPLGRHRSRHASALGIPLGIRQVAELIGCSIWTVRQTLIPRGLPCLRFSPNVQIMFYTEHVITWITTEQTKISATAVNPGILRR